MITAFCRNCITVHPFKVVAEYVDGSRALTCERSGSTKIVHNCQESGLSGYSSFWPRVTELLLREACPNCGAVYDLAEQVRRVPDAPGWVKPLADTVQGIAIGVAVAALTKVVVDALAPQRS